MKNKKNSYHSHDSLTKSSVLCENYFRKQNCSQFNVVSITQQKYAMIV